MAEINSILIEKQINSIEPIRPTIEVETWGNYTEKSLSPTKLAKIILDENGIYKGRSNEEIIFNIFNLGKMDSGWIDLRLSSNFTLERRIRLDNVSSRGFETVIFKVWHRFCYEGNQELCVPSEVPTGMVSFLLEVDCPTCANARFNQSFDVCITEGSSCFLDD